MATTKGLSLICEIQNFGNTYFGKATKFQSYGFLHFGVLSNLLVWRWERPPGCMNGVNYPPLYYCPILFQSQHSVYVISSKMKIGWLSSCGALSTCQTLSMKCFSPFGHSRTGFLWKSSDCHTPIKSCAAETINDYAKDGAPGAVWPSCSFHHDPLRHQLLYLPWYEAHIHNLASNSYPEPVYQISKSYELK